MKFHKSENQKDNVKNYKLSSNNIGITFRKKLAKMQNTQTKVPNI